MYNTILAENNQPEKLRALMEAANISHGEKVFADISNVRIGVNTETGQPVMFFCPTKEVTVKERIAAGDGGELPDSALLVGDLPAAENGHYNLRNVLLDSNGHLQVIVQADTVLERII